MSKNRKLVRAIQNFYQQFSRKSPSTVKEQSLWLLRTFIVTKKRPDWVNAGFVLPTVAMVSLVVVLLTIAILFRSFERSKNASNVRVNQAVLNAATPALDRARAKIDRLFSDPRLPRSTPNDFSLHQVISNNVEEFTFGDESQLTLFYDINGNGNRTTDPDNLTDDENLNTAWKYPVDTDNNGKFDSYTLYSIKFRNPPQSGGNSTRARNPLEARTPPMNETRGSNVCDRGENTSAQLIGSQGWYQRGSTLRRSIFVYTTTVPITNTEGLNTTNKNKPIYEEFKGNKGFAALEYQQDRERRPLTNNAVLYNDDLQISPGGGINLNGRILTNSNLLTAARSGSPTKPIKFFLVSSPDSCYFNERYSKIIVGGNVANARITDTSTTDSKIKPVDVDLFRPMNVGDNPTAKQITKSNTSIDLPRADQIAYNSGAYEKRVDLLVRAAQALSNNDLPTEIQEELTDRVNAGKNEATEKKALLRSYFRKRTRRVPYAEVSFANTDTESTDGFTVSNVLGNTKGDEMRPPNKWVFPFDPDDGKTYGGYAKLPLNENGNKKIYLKAQKTDFPEPEGEEKYLGDRVLVGNNLPQMWWDDTKNKFVSQEEAGQEIDGKEWDEGSGTRKRYPQVSELDDLGETGRDQFWEESAAIYPKDKLDVVGGLRVVTGAGIYLPKGFTTRDSRFNTALSTTDKVWSDRMPIGVTEPVLSTVTDPTIKGLPSNRTPYLQMRATAVYHFQSSAYNPDTPSTDPQTPIACVSSYYDPTNVTTARNKTTLPDFPDTTDPLNQGAGGQSNNGIVYLPPNRDKSYYQNVLNYQASLKYPNGRLINKQLKKALDKGSNDLTLAEKSALDSAICALQILDGSRTPNSTVIPHGAIRETAFLDARQVKAVDKPRTASETTYDLDVELRQPLEIRATVLDLKALKNEEIGDTTHGTTEYLLPNSGIIYATRDDALPDLSDDSDPNDNDDKIDTSATDFKLDRTRRPNAIMLVNGEELNRTNANLNRPEEKGLILASNLPVYIKGDFNKHQHEEFTNTLDSTWSNFYDRTNLNKNFACRTNQFTGCNSGEKWRPTTVIADAITVLSGNFREGFRNEGDYDIRDNWGYAPLGYDADDDDDIDTTAVTLNESLLKLDLNGDNDTNDAVTIEEKDIPSVVAYRLNGFWDNNFITSFPWQDNVAAEGTSGFGFPANLEATPKLIRSSYFNNFATPIQRRAGFSEYVMEICRKPTVAACKPEDWSIGYASGSNIDWSYKAVDSGTNRIEPNYEVNRLGAGTTARPALNPDDRRYPRRVAFLRDATGNLILDNGNPVVLGISGTDNPTTSAQDNAGQVAYYLTNHQNGTTYPKFQNSNRPRLHPRALWFKTREGNNFKFGYKFPLWVENRANLTSSNNQPLLIPVLQIHFPFREPGESTGGNLTGSNDFDVKDRVSNWLQIAEDTETNLVFAQGDTPARPNESNGGLENFVRYLERWVGATHKASGSFIQYKRSSYATAPWYSIVADYSNSKSRGFSPNGTIFGYPQMYRITVNNHPSTTLGRTPFYIQPDNRVWGFDVALLTQLPDLFSQRFTAPPNGDPNQFYREVSRDDDWVSTLLCAAQPINRPGNFGAAPANKYVTEKDRDDGVTSKEYAIPEDQRPSQCR